MPIYVYTHIYIYNGNTDQLSESTVSLIYKTYSIFFFTKIILIHSFGASGSIEKMGENESYCIFFMNEYKFRKQFTTR